MKNYQIGHALHLLVTLNGFELISTNTQLKRGNLMFRDTKQKGVEYAIYGDSGYVRKRNVMASGMWGDNRWWQLNQTRQVPCKWGNGQRMVTERILTPGDYIGMAKTILRVANKSRK